MAALGHGQSPVAFSRCLETQPGPLNLLIREEPNQGFIGQVSNLNAVSPRIPKVATEAWVQLEFVLVPKLAPDC